MYMYIYICIFLIIYINYILHNLFIYTRGVCTIRLNEAVGRGVSLSGVAEDGRSHAFGTRVEIGAVAVSLNRFAQPSCVIRLNRFV